MGTGSPSREYTGKGMALTIHTHLSTRLKKEYNYSFTPPMGLYVLLYSDFNLNVPVLITVP